MSSEHKSRVKIERLGTCKGNHNRHNEGLEAQAHKQETLKGQRRDLLHGLTTLGPGPGPGKRVIYMYAMR